MPYLRPIQSPAPPRHFRVLCSHQAPYPQPSSLGRCRPHLDENCHLRPLQVEETWPQSRVHQAHTVPGNYRGGRGSQRNVAYLLTVSCWAKFRGRWLAPYIPGRTERDNRDHFWRVIHSCLHAARCREIYSARQMYCCCCILLQLLLLCIAPAAAAVVLRLLLRLLLLPLLHLLGGCDKNRAGDSGLDG